jgi:cytochrome c
VIAAQTFAGAALLSISAGVVAAAPAPKADAAHGQQIFARCAACHMVGPVSGTRMGPALNGVVGRKAGSVVGYNYSAAMKNSGLKWDAPTLARFLAAPMKTVPGTKMAFPGLANAQDQADVVAYLKQYRTDGTKK